jgi:hypothetical protein
MRDATVPECPVNLRSRVVRRPWTRRCSSTTTSVPTPVRRMRAAASARVASGAMVYGSAMMPCCFRLTIWTSRTCGSISPLRNPRSMMPMPPSSATAIAISDRVTVSMLAVTIGRLRVRRRDSRDDRSIADGSRRSTTLYCGVKRKSSKVQPRTKERRSDMSTDYNPQLPRPNAQGIGGWKLEVGS